MSRLRHLAVLATAIGLCLPAGAGATVTAQTTTEQVARFTAKPNTQYSTYFYAYHYAGDPYPYALSYSGLPSNARGEYKASVLLSDLAAYEGGETSVYSVKACLQEPPSSVEVACTPYSYVGYYPESLAFPTTTALTASTTYSAVERCYQDAEKIANFIDARIANTPNPQLTFETGIYINRAGGIETYKQVLYRISVYMTGTC